MRILLLFLSIILFSGCAEEDVPVQNFNTAVVGKWHRLGKPGKDTFTYHNNLCPSENDYWEFFANGSGTVMYFNENCEEGVTYPFTWKIVERSLVLNVPGGGRIVSVTDNELVVGYINGGEVMLSFVYYR